MFIAEELAYELVGSVRGSVEEIGRRDRDLADQARRAASSVALNLAEGAQRRGKDRLHHYRIAAGSCSELKAALRLACAWGYLDDKRLGEPLSLIRRLLAITWKLTQPVAA